MAVMNFSETAAAPEVGLKHANLQHPIIFVLLWLFKRVDFYLCYAPPVLSWARHRYFHSFPHPPLSFSPHLDSPLSFLFHALSDMSQGSSDEDSEEEEDFARIQFGSRYTMMHGVGVYVLVCACGSVSLTTNRAQTHLNLGTLQLQTVHLLNRGLAITSHCWSLDGRKY